MKWYESIDGVEFAFGEMGDYYCYEKDGETILDIRKGGNYEFEEMKLRGKHKDRNAAKESAEKYEINEAIIC
jgi:hypothetical protein